MILDLVDSWEQCPSPHSVSIAFMQMSASWHCLTFAFHYNDDYKLANLGKSLHHIRRV